MAYSESALCAVCDPAKRDLGFFVPTTLPLMEWPSKLAPVPPMTTALKVETPPGKIWMTPFAGRKPGAWRKG